MRSRFGQGGARWRILRLLLVFTLGGGALPAAAQVTPTPTPRASNENGIKVGEGRLHPFFEFGANYDSNILTTPQGERVRDFVLHFKPGLNLDVPGNAAALTLSGNLDYNLYLDAFDEGPKGLDSSKLSRLLADADTGVTFNPNGAVLAHVGGHFTRSDQTSVLLLGQSAISNVVEGRFRLGFQPGGKALVIEPGYTVTWEHLENADIELNQQCGINDPICNGNASRFNRLSNTIHLDGRWRFLPKTALVANSSLASAHFFSSGGNDSANLRVSAGLQGLLTNKFSLTAKVGWGTQFGSGTFSSIIGQLEAAWLFSEQAQVRVGYVRTFEPAPVDGNNYRDDKFYLDGRVLLASRLALHGGVSYDIVSFSSGRSDGLLHLDLGPDVQITSWFTAGLSYGYTNRTASNAKTSFPLDYDRNEVGLRLVFIY